MGFDRSKYKPTPMAALKAQDDQHESIRPSGGNKNNYLDIKNGDNKFRIFMRHPDGGGKTYSEAKTITFLPVTTKSKDDKGNVIEGKTEIKRRPIFNSKVHGDLKIDLVEEYLKIAKERGLSDFSEDKAKQDAIWAYITNGMSGIRPSDTWMVYACRWEADHWGPIGLLELKKTMKTQLKEKAIEYIGDDDDLVSPDPFTDPDEGIAIIINKSGEKIDTEYKVRMEQKQGKYIQSPLTDDQLEAFTKLEPLFKMYNKVFKFSDLELQIEGLKNYEDELSKKKIKTKSGDEFSCKGFSVFQYDSFQDVIDQLLTLVPEDTKSDKTDVEEEEVKPAKKAEVVVKEKPVKVTKTISKPAPAPEPEPEPDEPEVEAEEAEVEVAAKSNVLSRVEELRRKAGLGKK